MQKIFATLKSTGRPVELRGPIDSDEDRLALRADTEFHDGTVALLKYPSKNLAFFGTEPPRMYPIPDGGYLMKGEAGDLQPMFAVQVEHELEEVSRG